MIKNIFCALLLLVLINCQSVKPEDASKANLNGFWEQQGEGEIIEINDSLVISYYSNSFSCYPNWKISREYFNTQTPTLVVNKDQSLTNQEGYTLFHYKKLKEKPDLCKDLTEAQKNNNTFNFETLWHTYNDQYAFFEERNIDWKQLKSKYKAQFTDETEAFEFYLLLEKMVLELKDEHSDFEVPEDFEDQWDALFKINDTINYGSVIKEHILEASVTNVKKYNHGQLAWGFVEGDIGYIQLNGMDGLANYGTNITIDDYWEIAEESDDYISDLLEDTHAITERIIGDLKNTKACIVDLRMNGGGYDQVGLAFLSHFIDKDYKVFKKKRRLGDGFEGHQTINIPFSKNNYLKKVYVLTSPYTVSAAETVILATLNFPNFERVGSHTNGALSDVLVKELPNGWEFWLSNEVYESIDGEIYEVSGIPPNYNIDYPRDEYEFFKFMYSDLNTKDKAIEKVLELED